MDIAQKKIGNKKEVFKGLATKTVGGLTKDDLLENKRGKIVSKRKHFHGKRCEEHLQRYWTKKHWTQRQTFSEPDLELKDSDEEEPIEDTMLASDQIEALRQDIIKWESIPNCLKITISVDLNF
jgi:hypothetical protein